MIDRKVEELRDKQERYAELGRQLQQSLGIERALNSLGIPFEWPVRVRLHGSHPDHVPLKGRFTGITVNGVRHKFDEPMEPQEWEALKQGGE